ncbi:hypothetical protein Ae406Ps2_6457 [Pseudonocardia sp. Ae406_Ps2]|nr:hypothetical protein Ae406Ps2_6457 [Pseudonocardia sp. Ae406_Ps2]
MSRAPAGSCVAAEPGGGGGRLQRCPVGAGPLSWCVVTCTCPPRPRRSCGRPSSLVPWWMSVSRARTISSRVVSIHQASVSRQYRPAGSRRVVGAQVPAASAAPVVCPARVRAARAGAGSLFQPTCSLWCQRIRAVCSGVPGAGGEDPVAGSGTGGVVRRARKPISETSEPRRVWRYGGGGSSSACPIGGSAVEVQGGEGQGPDGPAGQREGGEEADHPRFQRHLVEGGHRERRGSEGGHHDRAGGDPAGREWGQTPHPEQESSHQPAVVDPPDRPSGR